MTDISLFSALLCYDSTVSLVDGVWFCTLFARLACKANLLQTKRLATLIQFS